MDILSEKICILKKYYSLHLRFQISIKYNRNRILLESLNIMGEEVTDIRISDLEMRRCAPLKHPFRVFITSFRIFGIDLEGGNDKDYSIKSTVFQIWSALVALFLHYRLISEVVWYKNNFIQENALAESIAVWTSVLTFDKMLSNKIRIQRFMAVVKVEASKTDKKVLKKQMKFSLIVCCSIWFYVFLYILQYLIFRKDEEYETQHVSPLGLLGNYVPSNYKIYFFRLFLCLECFFVQGILTFTMGFYLLICFNIINWFKILKDKYAPNSCQSTLNLEHVQRFIQLFENLSQNVKIFDNVFSASVAVWLLMILSNLCVRIVTIVNPTMPITKQMAAMIFLTFSRSAATLIGMCFIADFLNKNIISTLFLLDALCGEGSIVLDDTVYNEIQMAFTRYSFNPTHLTMWNIMRLDRRFLMTCIGMMTTYVIISIQIYPNTAEGLTDK